MSTLPKIMPMMFLPRQYPVVMHPDPAMPLEFTLGCALANVLDVQVSQKKLNAIVALLKQQGIVLAL